MTIVPNRVCSKCGISKPETNEFYARSTKCRNGLRGTCKRCAVEQARQSYFANLEQRKAYMLARHHRTYVRKTPIQCRLKECSRCKRLLQPGKENFALKSSQCRACGAESARLNHEAHRAAALVPEKTCTKCGEVKPNTREYFYKGTGCVCKVCFKENVRAYHRAHPEATRAKGNNRRARELAAGGTFGKADVQAKLAQQKGLCYWCRTPLGSNYHVDHVMPLSKGGSNGPENIVCACSTCNLSKGAKMPWEFAARLF